MSTNNFQIHKRNMVSIILPELNMVFDFLFVLYFVFLFSQMDMDQYILAHLNFFISFLYLNDISVGVLIHKEAFLFPIFLSFDLYNGINSEHSKDLIF